MIKADTIILLPARNEENAIGTVIDDVHNVGFHNIVVVASDCEDRTVEVANGHGANVLPNAPRGKAAAVNYALRRIEAKKIIMLDSDATYPAKSIPEFVRQLDKYKVVSGNRQFNSNNMSTLNQMGNAFITYQAQMLHGLHIKDLCTGMWGFQGDAIKKLNIKSHGFTLEAELFVFTARNRLSFGQIPIEYYPRIGEKKINRLDHLKIMWYLWSRSLT